MAMPGVRHAQIEVRTQGAGTYEVTSKLEELLGRSGLTSGVATLFCPHTSCSLVALENASPEARRDLQAFVERLGPEDARFEHSLEGRDDMPSHIKMALTRTSESIPFRDGRFLLGPWQGVFLWEHRRHPHVRTLHLALVGE